MDIIRKNKEHKVHVKYQVARLSVMSISWQRSDVYHIHGTSDVGDNVLGLGLMAYSASHRA